MALIKKDEGRKYMYLSQPRHHFPKHLSVEMAPEYRVTFQRLKILEHRYRPSCSLHIFMFVGYQSVAYQKFLFALF